MQEMWVWHLDWEDPLEKEWRPTPVFLPGKSHGERNWANYSTAAVAKSHQPCPTLCDGMDGSPPGSRRWDFPGKNTGVGCHFLLQCMKVKSESEVVQSCPTFCDPMDCSLRPTLCDGMDGSPPGCRPWDSPGKSTGVGCHCYSTQGCKRVINNLATKQQRGLLKDVPKPF